MASISYNEKEKQTKEHVEDAGRRYSTADEVDELSTIESTAASTAAWLFSITVSLGGFLFGSANDRCNPVCDKR